MGDSSMAINENKTKNILLYTSRETLKNTKQKEQNEKRIKTYLLIETPRKTSSPINFL